MVLGTLAGTLPSSMSAQQSAAALVFDGVTVVDVEQGKLIPGQRVVIAGNRIAAMGSMGAVKLPQSARVVDGQGKYLIPGLWDLHTHRGLTPDRDAAVIDYLLPLANGVTGIRDAYSDYVPLDSQVVWWREILAGTRAGPPRQLLAGSKLNGLSEQDIADLKARGANFLKLYPFEPELAATARRTGLPFGGHVDPPVTAIEASDGGMNILDHVMSAGDLNDRCLGSRESSPATLEQCRTVAERFKQNNSWWCPTLIRRISFGNADHPTNPGDAANVVRDRLFQMADQFWAGTSPKPGWLHGVVTHPGKPDSLRFLTIAERAGLPILSGTDTDGTEDMLHKTPKGFALHAELAIYVTEGLTPLEALQSATLNPARMLRATDSLGTVAAGKLADLVLLDADPLADITNTTTIRAVVANGGYFDRATLDNLLAEVRATVDKQP